MPDTLPENGRLPPSFPWRRYGIAFLISHSIALVPLLPMFLSQIFEDVCLLGARNGACTLSGHDGANPWGLFFLGEVPILGASVLLSGACTLVLIVHRTFHAFRYAGADKPKGQPSAFPWRFYALAFVFIDVMMISPAIPAGLAEGSGELFGCAVDFAGASGSCKILGHDWGGLLSYMDTMGWYILITFIVGLVLSSLLCLAILIHLAYRALRSRHPKTA